MAAASHLLSLLLLVLVAASCLVRGQAADEKTVPLTCQPGTDNKVVCEANFNEFTCDSQQPPTVDLACANCKKKEATCVVTTEKVTCTLQSESFTISKAQLKLKNDCKAKGTLAITESVTTCSVLNQKCTLACKAAKTEISELSVSCEGSECEFKDGAVTSLTATCTWTDEKDCKECTLQASTNRKCEVDKNGAISCKVNAKCDVKEAHWKDGTTDKTSKCTTKDNVAKCEKTAEKIEGADLQCTASKDEICSACRLNLNISQSPKDCPFSDGDDQPCIVDLKDFCTPAKGVVRVKCDLCGLSPTASCWKDGNSYSCLPADALGFSLKKSELKCNKLSENSECTDCELIIESEAVKDECKIGTNKSSCTLTSDKFCTFAEESTSVKCPRCSGDKEQQTADCAKVKDKNEISCKLPSTLDFEAIAASLECQPITSNKCGPCTLNLSGKKAAGSKDCSFGDDLSACTVKEPKDFCTISTELKAECANCGKEIKATCKPEGTTDIKCTLPDKLGFKPTLSQLNCTKNTGENSTCSDCKLNVNAASLLQPVFGLALLSLLVQWLLHRN